MNISVILPIEYECGETIDMLQYGIRGTGIVVDSRLGKSNVEYEVPDKEVCITDLLFSLAEDIFCVTKEEIRSPRRFERFLFPRIAIAHALVEYAHMPFIEVKEILNRDKCSIYHYMNIYNNLEFFKNIHREKMIEFDKRAKLILTEKRHGNA